MVDEGRSQPIQDRPTASGRFALGCRYEGLSAALEPASGHRRVRMETVPQLIHEPPDTALSLPDDQLSDLGDVIHHHAPIGLPCGCEAQKMASGLTGTPVA